MQSSSKRKIRFGLKSIMLFTLIVSVGLGLAVAKLRRQKEGRKVVAELRGHGSGIDFVQDYERQVNYVGDPFLGFFVVEDLGWQYDLFTPDILKTIESFHGPVWWTRGDEYPKEFEAGISEMTNLKTLVLSNEIPFESLAAMADLRKLETLAVGEPSFVTADTESFLPSLTEQHLALMEAKPPRTWDLTPLSDLKQLKHLCLGDCGKSDLTPLAGMISIETLDLQVSYTMDLSPLSQLTELRALGLAGAHAKDLTPLGGLQKLTKLDLSGAKAIDFGMLAKLRNLATLKASGTKVEDLSSLANLQELNYVTLGDTPVSDISALSGKTKLQRLFLSNTNVSDVSPLATCAALAELDLSHSMVEDVSPLVHCKALQELNLTACPVKDLSPLSGCNMRIILGGTQKVIMPDDIRRHVWRRDMQAEEVQRPRP